MDPTARQQRIWDRSAARWDDAANRLERGLIAGGREWVGSRAHGRVLEVGIGTGRSLDYYAADTRVTGLELSTEMLVHADRHARAIGRDAELVQGDAQHLPFDSDTFDTVVAQLVLCSVPDHGLALREMARVLRPGGSLLLIDHVGSSWPPIYAGMWLVERVTIPAAGEHLTRRQLPLVTAAGLRVVEQERLKLGIIERIHAVKD